MFKLVLCLSLVLAVSSQSTSSPAPTTTSAPIDYSNSIFHYSTGPAVNGTCKPYQAAYQDNCIPLVNMPYKNPANATGLCPLGLCPLDNFCLAGYCYSEPDPSEAVGPCDFEREQICPDHHYCHVNQCYITPRTWPAGYVDYSGTVFAWSTAPVNGTCTYPYILYRGSCVISLLMPEKDSADSAGTCVDTCSLPDHYCLDGYCYPEPEPELSAGPCVPGIIDCPQYNYECISGGCYIKAPVY